MARRSGRRARRTLPASVEAVGERIEEWRTTRHKRTRMPEDLWEAAATAAAEHGVWFVSRALRVNYESLKQRVGSPPETGGVPGFVEVSPAEWVDQDGSATTVVELSSKDGARMTVRLEGQRAVDVPALAADFWERHG